MPKRRGRRRRACPSSGAASSRCRARCACGEVCPVPRLCSYGHAGRASQRPDAPGDYGPDGALGVAGRRLARAPAVGAGRGRPVNVIDIGGGRRVVFIHGLSGSWLNWLENIPHFAREHRVIAMDLPGFGALADARREDLDLRLRADRRRAARQARGRARVVVGNSMGGFIGAEVAIRFPTRVEKLVLVSAAGLSIEHLRNERAARGARRAREPPGRLQRLAGDALGRAARGAAAARRHDLRLVAHRPDRLPAPLVAEQVRGSGKPGFVAGARRAHRLPDPRPAGRDRLPDAGRLGRGGPARAGRATPTSSAADPRTRAGRLARHRPRRRCSSARRAFNALVQAFLAEEPGERVGARGRAPASSVAADVRARAPRAQCRA